MKIELEMTDDSSSDRYWRIPGQLPDYLNWELRCQ